MRESEVEKHFNRLLKEKGARSCKWTGTLGCPDRIVFFRGKVFFVELKAPGGCLRPWQKRFHKKLVEHGQHVHVLRSKEEVSQWVFVLSASVSDEIDGEPVVVSWRFGGYGPWKDGIGFNRSSKTQVGKLIKGRASGGSVKSGKNNVAKRNEEMAAPPEPQVVIDHGYLSRAELRAIRRDRHILNELR